MTNYFSTQGVCDVLGVVVDGLEDEATLLTEEASSVVSIESSTSAAFLDLFENIFNIYFFLKSNGLYTLFITNVNSNVCFRERLIGLFISDSQFISTD